MKEHERGRLALFDTRCRIGRRRAPAPGEPNSVDELQDYRTTYGIAGAAVEHAVAAESSPALGNRMLMDEIAGRDGLYPAWHVMPPVSERIEPALTDPAPLLEAGVVLTRVDAKEFWDGLTSGYEPTLRALEAVHMPLAIDMAGSEGFLRFPVTAFERFGGIPFIVENFGGYPLHRLVWTMRTFPNVHLSTAGFTLHRGVEFICEELGPERLVFGSGWPAVPPGLGLGPVLLNGLDETARRMVGGENFRRLMEGIG